MMRSLWGAEGTDRGGNVPAGSGPENQEHGLVGSAEKSLREMLLLSVSMVLVLFNLLGQRRGDGPQP
jgi:hypothetical protein